MLALVLLAVIAGGTLATYLCDEDEMPLPVRVAAGAAVGLAVFALSGFVLALGLGLTRTALWGATLMAAAPLVLLHNAERRARVAADSAETLAMVRRHPRPSLALLAIAAVVAVAFEGALYLRVDGLYSADRHNLGDLPFHIGIVESFLRGEDFPPEHPELSGVRLTYPFLSDFGAAALMRAGASLRAAFLAQNLLLAWALLAATVYWGWRLTRDQAVARLMPILLLLNGGLGFWMLARDALTTERGLIPLLGALPHDYTILSRGELPWMVYALRWGNAVTTLLIPQRGFLFGLALFVLALALMWDGARKNSGLSETARMRRMLAAGSLAALLPLVHMHSFLVLVSAAVCLVVLFPGVRAWSRFFVPVVVLAGPQVFWLLHGTGIAQGSFVQWRVGWDRAFEGPLWFWFYNTGLAIPAVAAALVWRESEWLVSRDLARFLAPFAGCFLLPNLLQLSPWLWDNIKFLFFAHVAATPLLALLIVKLWRFRRWGARAASVVLLVSLTLAGALDVTRMTTRQGAQRIFDASTMRFAEMLAENTPPRAVILRAPTYNHAALLAGRLSPLGYAGHVWSQGMDKGTREQDVAAIYRGAPDARARLSRLHVDYLVVGPQERAELQVNEAFVGSLPLVGEMDGYRLYRVRNR
jgi:hypothetical protein